MSTRAWRYLLRNTACLGVGLGLLVGCGTGGGRDAGAGAVDAILNGPTQAGLTTYWVSASDKGCIVQNDPALQNPTNTCYGPINFALSVDGAALWSAGYGLYGTTTWTRLGDTALVINSLPFTPTSLNLNSISGAASAGTFVANSSSYSNIQFTLQTGKVPGWCQAPLVPAGGQCVDTSTDVSACGSQLVNCSTALQNATGASCGNGACNYSGCATGYLDCDGNRANGCELIEAAQCTGVQNASAPSFSCDGGCGYTCNAGWVDCDGNTANGCEAAGASCAFTLAKAQSIPLFVAVDRAWVYWTNSGDGTVWKVPIDGGSAVQVASGQGSPQGIAVDPGSVYWTTGAGVIQQPLDGGAAIPLATGQNGSLGIALDSAYAYWTNSFGGTVMRAPIGGGSVLPVASGLSSPSGIATDGESVFVGTGTGVIKASTDGGTALSLAPGPATAVAIDGTSVYFSTGGNSGLAKVPLDGGPVVPLATEPGATVIGVAVDATGVYWTTSDRSTYQIGTVKRALLDGGSQVLLVSGQYAPQGIALDGTWVYWTTYNGASVAKAPK